MRYEFFPRLLEKWVEDFRARNGTTGGPEWNTSRYETRVERVQRTFRTFAERNDIDGYWSWVGQLDRRDRLALPFLFESAMNAEWKIRLAETVRRYVEFDYRLFRIMVEAMHRTVCLDPLWELIRYAYMKHSQRLDLRLGKYRLERWHAYLASEDPMSHLIQSVLYQEADFTAGLQVYFLSENTPFFKQLFLASLKDAEESYFIRQTDRFKQLFTYAVSIDQQYMADCLIRNCSLNRVSQLAQLIFDTMGTYKQKPMLWEFVGEAQKRKFVRWLLRRELKEFFAGVNQGHIRYKYWSKFVRNMEDVVVTDRNTLIMYFHDVVIIEVLGVGAVYVYDIHTFNEHFQKKIDQMLHDREMAKDKPWFRVREVRRSELLKRDLTLPGGWLRHTGQWQQEFDHWLRSTLRWEVREDVLLQEENEE